MRNVWVWLVAFVVIVAAGAWYWQSAQPAALSDDGTPLAADAVDVTGALGSSTPVVAASTSEGASVTSGAPVSATVTFDGASFSPAAVTIAKGGTVTFTSTAGNMWVASDPHPVHTGYDGTSLQQHCAAGYAGPAPFDECKPGTSFTFTFNKIGTWGYHDHMNHAVTGTIVVR